MTYTPYLIANYATGLEKRLQPWLLADDAQEELFDGFVYRGVLSKRSGYNYFADGQRGGQPYTISRIVANFVLGNGTVGPYIFTLARTPITPGTVSITDGVQIVTDNGAGVLTGGGTGTVNYLTGAVSVTFTVAVGVGVHITSTLLFFPDEPVMGIMNFVTATNVKQLIVASTTRVNRYNPALNILEDITATLYTGTNFNFWSWVNYSTGAGVPRLLFSNNVDNIQQYSGGAVTAYVPALAAGTIERALLMFEFKDRLVLLRTTENGGTIFPRRIRISGTGLNSDVFLSSATGAGFIDIPDGSWIMGAAFNRDSLIIFTESSTWSLNYTGNDTSPFVLDKIDESRGSGAPFSAITYLNKTTAASPRGLIISDGYAVERSDESIPDFTFNEVDSDDFELCFAGSVDEDRDHYLIYPHDKQGFSTRILTTNYDEDNYSIYRLPISCMGTYILGFDITWADLSKYTNWAEFAADYGDWNSFAYNEGSPFTVGGGHHGEIWKLNVNGIEDNPVRILNVTVIDAQTIEVTTDWNNYSLNALDQEKGADNIFLTAMVGMDEINNQQFPIVSVINNNVFRLNVSNAIILATSFTPYVSGGKASRVIPFSALFKKFNPFVNGDKKVRCGWLYMYVDSTGTSLKRNVVISNITKNTARLPTIVTTPLNHSLVTGNQVSFFGIAGMTQLNGTVAFITVLSPTTFSLNGVNSTAFGAYTSGGYASVSALAKMTIDIITDDRTVDDLTQVSNNANPYQGACTNLIFEDGKKKWYKVFINQTGRFIQFRLRNLQSGSKINVQATMPGFSPTGRLL